MLSQAATGSGLPMRALAASNDVMQWFYDLNPTAVHLDADGDWSVGNGAQPTRCNAPTFGRRKDDMLTIEWVDCMLDAAAYDVAVRSAHYPYGDSMSVVFSSSFEEQRPRITNLAAEKPFRLDRLRR
jgi:hypothetical protein